MSAQMDAGTNAERAARAIGDAHAEAVAMLIEAEARAEYPMLLVTREGTSVTIAGRGLARLRLDDPLLANPALLAQVAP